ncbi:MAG: porin [Planctomycetia bacterium]|nr:porin [Planctomycetia bacterium]
MESPRGGVARVCRAVACMAVIATLVAVGRPAAAVTFAALREEAAEQADGPATPPVAFDPTMALAQIADPAIETVDEMTVGAPPGSGRTVGPGDGSFARQLGERFANVQDPAIETVDEQTVGGNDHSGEKEWFEKINLRGYTQFRINDTLWYDPDGAGPYHPNDKSVGPNNGFYIRRCRLIFSGDLSDRLYFYIQPDFASGLSGVSDPGAINYAQLRDCYGDCYITTDKVHRVRVGQSKVPYGWDNMQSSSNRLPLDRADFINATKSERGLGVFYYWTGCYNGQGNSTLDQNNNMHFVMRLNSPYQFDDGQVVEAGVQAYCGNYVPTVADIKIGGNTYKPVVVSPSNGVLDQRICATFVYYPQRLGVTAEWNVGLGPQLSSLSNVSKANPPTISSQPVSGGYVLVNYKNDTERFGRLFPYFRWQMGRGGYLWERNSPNTYLGEFDLGLEWQITPQMELTCEYDWVNRTNTSGKAPILANGQYAQFQGDLLRFQFQINY